MSQRMKNMTPSQIKSIFKSHYYKCIPIVYINHIKIRYDNDVVKRYNRAQISNKIDSMNQKYAKVFNLYNDEDISEIQIDLRFDKMADDSNSKIASWYDEIIEEIKSED